MSLSESDRRKNGKKFPRSTWNLKSRKWMFWRECWSKCITTVLIDSVICPPRFSRRNCPIRQLSKDSPFDLTNGSLALQTSWWTKGRKQRVLRRKRLNKPRNQHLPNRIKLNPKALPTLETSQHPNMKKELSCGGSKLKKNEQNGMEGIWKRISKDWRVANPNNHKAFSSISTMYTRLSNYEGWLLYSSNFEL